MTDRISSAETLQNPLPRPVVILCVDDERAILTALRRVLARFFDRVLIASSGSEALEILQMQTVDVVISDMQMPEMNGAQLLNQIRETYPDTVRVLLTGYSDLSSTIEAVNQGEIFRYLSKPWDDLELVGVVNAGLDRLRLQRDNAELLALTASQNIELKKWNLELEQRVEERTAQVREAHLRLKQQYMMFIKTQSALTDARLKGYAVAGHKLAKLARGFAQRLALPVEEVQNVYVASLLANMGMLTLPDAALNGHPLAMSITQWNLYREHPQKAFDKLRTLEDFKQVATVVHSWREQFDGRGFPQGLSAQQIPLGARILAIAEAYLVSYELGVMDEYGRRRPVNQGPQAEAAALSHVLEQSGSSLDPDLVDDFISWLTEVDASSQDVLSLHVDQLVAGMTLRGAVRDARGEVIVSDGTTLTVELIGLLQITIHKQGLPNQVMVDQQGIRKNFWERMDYWAGD